MLSRFLLNLLFLAPFTLFAQIGYLDTSFGHQTSDFEFSPDAGEIGKFGNVIEQPDGKIIATGIFSTVGGYSAKTIVRFFSDGTVDTSFHSPFESYNTIQGIALQSDGKIIVYGALYFLGAVDLPSNSLQMGRLNPNGSRDLTFSNNSFGDFIYNCEVLSDNSIIVSGGFTYVNGNGNPYSRIVKMNSNGTIDNSFNTGTVFNGPIYDFKVLPNNDIVVVGQFGTVNGLAYSGIALLNSDGELNPSFTSSGTPLFYEHIFETVAIDQNGKFIVGGRVISFASEYENVYRFNADGTLDTTFYSHGNQYHRITESIIQPDGKIVLSSSEVMEYDDEPVKNIFRLNPDGHIDLTFTATNAFDIGWNISIYNMYETASHEIIVSGTFNLYEDEIAYKIAKLNINGDLVPNFPASYGFEGNVEEVKIQSDDKIIVVGDFTQYQSSTSRSIIRLLPSGDVDQSFDVGTGANDKINGSLIQQDGKIIVVGNFTSFNDQPISYICRLNTDGSIDNTFDLEVNAKINKIVPYPNGGFIITGEFSSVNSVNALFLARITDSGTLDPSFVSEGFSSGVPTKITVNSLGEITVSGPFSHYGSAETEFITSINSDGTMNTSGLFLQNLNLNNSPEFISYCSDDSLLITTSFKTIKCSVFGVEDLDFYSNFNINGSHNKILSLNQYSENRLLVTGNFMIPNQSGGEDHLSVVRISSNGIPETGFLSTYYGDVKSSALLSDQNLICGGDFNGIQFPVRAKIAKVTICATTTYDTIIRCLPFTTTDNITYSSPGIYDVVCVYTNVNGCDSTVNVNLTIATSIPIELISSYSSPSDVNDCLGQLAVTVEGGADFELDINNGAQTATSSGYSLFTGLCPGVHDLQIVNSCGDTTTTQFVIPVDTNYVFTNPFIDSLAQDSLGTTIEDCDIYYAGIDTAYIDSIWATGNTVNVIWNIVDSNGSNLDTTSYELNNGNGVYWLQLSVFCPTKALGDYFTVTESIYFEDGTISTAGIGDWQETDILIYPNPTNNLVTVSFEGNKAELTIYDSQGKVIQNRSSIHSGEHVSLKDVQTGVYFFEIVTDEGKAVKRVVKN